MNHKKHYCDCSVCRLTEVKSVRLTLWVLEEGLKGVIVAGVLALAIAVLAGTPYQLFVAPKAAENIERLTEIRAHLSDISDQLREREAQNAALYGRLFRTSIHLHAAPRDTALAVRQFHLGGARHAPLDSAIITVQDAAARLKQQLARQQAVAAKREKWIDQSPIVLPASGNIASGFGMRLHPITKEIRLHQGIDIVLPAGTPILATGAGVVSMTDSTHGYGVHVRILHPTTGHLTIYAHLSYIPRAITPGRRVARGDLVGYSGDTGLATGPHLHYEIRSAHGLPIDPMEFFMPPRRGYLTDAFVRPERLLDELRAEGVRPSFTDAAAERWRPGFDSAVQKTPQRRAVSRRR